MTSNTLKLIALFLMFLDHIGQFIPNMPIGLRWVGRISAPIFLFATVWGFSYTHNKKLYLKRMYLFGVGMAILALLCNNFVPHAYTFMPNNIFVTLFLICLIAWLIEIKDKKLMSKFIGFQILALVLGFLAEAFIPLKGISLAIGALFPSIFFCEGSFLIVFLGVLMYFNKENKKSIILSYGGFCLVYMFISLSHATLYEIFYQNYQWMMIFALPFMLLYNGQKGKSMRYLFYIFYPAHILILFLLGNWINSIY